MNSNTISIRANYKRRKLQYGFKISMMLCVIITLVIVMLTCGNTYYPMSTVIKVINGENIKGAVFTIMTLRLPRMLSAVLCGIAFGIAGNTFQILLGNPLASPDIIGVTSGTSVAAVFGILILNISQTYVSIMAVCSGVLVALIIYVLSNIGEFSSARLILTGIGVQTFLNAIISWMILKASEYDVAGALRWLSGSLNGTKLENIPRLAVVVILASISILTLIKQLEILQLGDAYATTLGVRVNLVRLALIFCSILMIAFATSVTGPIASVAFLSGPIATHIFGKGQTNMLGAAGIGVILVMGADLIGQLLLPSRYPVGVITGILGAPYLIYLILRD